MLEVFNANRKKNFKKLGSFAMENELYPIGELAKGRVDTHLYKKRYWHSYAGLGCGSELDDSSELYCPGLLQGIRVLLPVKSSSDADVLVNALTHLAIRVQSTEYSFLSTPLARKKSPNLHSAADLSGILSGMHGG